MPKQYLVKSCGVATLALGLALGSSPAYAGFQWVSPEEESAYQQEDSGQYSQDVVVSASEIPGTGVSGAFPPVIISGAPPSSLPVLTPAVPERKGSTQAALGEVLSAQQAPVALVAESAVAAMPKNELASATINIAPSLSEDVVRGFASQIPLSLAVRQVLPVGYSFVLEQGVDADVLVSYKGGKTWRETMKDLLAPSGLVMRERGAEVSIGSGVAKMVGAPPSVAPSVVVSRPAEAVSAVPARIVPIAAVGAIPSVSVEASRSSSPVGVASSGEEAVGAWSAARGDMLRSVLREWCSRAGVELQWMAEYDYPMGASVRFNEGVGFEGAVRSLLAGFDGARPQPIGELYNNSGAGQKVLVIQARGNSYSN